MTNPFSAEGMQLRWVAGGFVMLMLLAGGIVESAHVAYRPLWVGIEGEDVYELQMTLGYFGQTLGGADGVLDERTFEALLALLVLDPDTAKVGGDYLQHLQWYHLASQWPQHAFVVRKDASWDEIARAFGVSAVALRLVNKNRLEVGQECLIPVEYNIHHIMDGDTLASVARRYAVESEELAYWNQLGTDDTLVVDEHLIVVMTERGISEGGEDGILPPADDEKVKNHLSLADQERVSCQPLFQLAEELGASSQGVGQCTDEPGRKITR